MGKTLVIAEKPSVGRDIARVIGCKQKGEGFLSSGEFVVSWAIGHLVTLYEPEDYDKGLKSWRAAALPIMPDVLKLKPVLKTKKQLDLLKKLMRSADVSDIICATDSGREGELIFRYIYTWAGCKLPVRRLWISSMTDEAIKEGFRKLRSSADYDKLYESAKCRSEADWLVGINATRAYTVNSGVLLSIGRVQTPTLALITARQNEINSFVPEDYYELTAGFDLAYGGKWFGLDSVNGDEGKETSRIKDLKRANELKRKVEGKRGMVSDITKKRERRAHPLLYDLTELQRDCNKSFGMSAAKTLSIAQDLYEKRKLITYPRTDSRHLSPDILPKLRGILQSLTIPPYTALAEHALGLGKLPHPKRVIDAAKVTDHHAIIPTGKAAKIESLSPDERNVFDLVCRRFISVFYPDYVYDTTKVISLVEGEKFASHGHTVVQYGWMELYRRDGRQTDGDGQLPELLSGQEILLESAEIEKKRTSPPPLYTEAALLTAMEQAGKVVQDEELRELMKESGLGTPATRAAIIERLLAVNYLIRKGKSLVPTEKAMKLIDLVPTELKSAETTGKWERGLSLIAKGGMESERFMGSIRRYVSFIVSNVAGNDYKGVFPAEEYKAKKPSAKAYKSRTKVSK